jgi:hypothetical protein
MAKGTAKSHRVRTEALRIPSSRSSTSPNLVAPTSAHVAHPTAIVVSPLGTLGTAVETPAARPLLTKAPNCVPPYKGDTDFAKPVSPFLGCLKF